MTSNVSHNFDITNNGITGIYNALQTITASNEINNTTYLAPEIILGDNFKATSNTEVLLSIENCSICNCVDNLGVSFGVSGGGAPGSIPSYWYTIDYNHAICENEGITYSWDFGNGVTYTGTTVIHPWTSMYQNVTVYATSPNGCTSTIVKKKLYTPPPASTPPPPTEVVIVVAKDYYNDKSFCRDVNGDINLWKFYNLLTGSNKSSYIDTFLDRGVNAFDFSKGISNALSDSNSNYSWFLS